MPCRAFVSQVITGYLPSLVLQLFLYVVPSIMIMFSSIQGYIAMSQIEKSACIKVLWFTIWNIFFANVLSGSALYRVEIFLEPKNIPAILAVAVPGQVSVVQLSLWQSSSWNRRSLILKCVLEGLYNINCSLIYCFWINCYQCLTDK